jgi:hypothetical protein
VAGVLSDKRQTHRRRALTDAQATHLIALACTAAPAGHARRPRPQATPAGHAHWTLRLLAGKAVELGFVAGISPETIRSLLKKTRSSPGATRSGVSRR